MLGGASDPFYGCYQRRSHRRSLSGHERSFDPTSNLPVTDCSREPSPKPNVDRHVAFFKVFADRALGRVLRFARGPSQGRTCPESPPDSGPPGGLLQGGGDLVRRGLWTPDYLVLDDGNRYPISFSVTSRADRDRGQGMSSGRAVREQSRAKITSHRRARTFPPAADWRTSGDCGDCGRVTIS